MELYGAIWSYVELYGSTNLSARNLHIVVIKLLDNGLGTGPPIGNLYIFMCSVEVGGDKGSGNSHMVGWAQQAVRDLLRGSVLRRSPSGNED